MNDGLKTFIAAPEPDRLDIFLAASRRLGTAVQNVPDNRTLQIVCYFAVSLLRNCTIGPVPLIAAIVAGVASL